MWILRGQYNQRWILTEGCYLLAEQNKNVIDYLKVSGGVNT